MARLLVVGKRGCDHFYIVGNEETLVYIMAECWSGVIYPDNDKGVKF